LRHASGWLANALITLICGAAIAGLWLAFHQRVSFERHQAITAAMGSNANLAIAYEQDVDRTLKAAEQVMSFVRTQYLQQGPDVNLRRWIQDGVVRDEAFTIISIVDAAGNIIDSSQQTGAINYSDREFFTVQRDSQDDALYVNPPVLGKVSGEWRVPMSLRITRPGGGFGGVVVLSVGPDTLTNFYREVDLGRDGLLEVTGLDGIVRGHKIGSQDMFGQDAQELPWFQRQKQDPEGNFVDNGAATDGIPRIISYRTLSDYPLMVVVGTPLPAILAPILQHAGTYRAITFYASAALLAFSLLVMYLLARQRAVSRALKTSESRLAHAALHDPLTGLPNRVLFQERCDRALQAALRHEDRLAVLYLDLDGFKDVNDQQGHGMGDILLQQVAARLAACVRADSEDTVSRFGGDEFCILLTGLNAPAEAEAIAQDILQTISRPFSLNGADARISVSIGAALYPDHGLSVDELIKISDTAMYTAKHTGKNRFAWGAQG
jgi:diguanylate cyclase (GGDEF)-like protein